MYVRRLRIASQSYTAQHLILSSSVGGGESIPTLRPSRCVSALHQGEGVRAPLRAVPRRVRGDVLPAVDPIGRHWWSCLLWSRLVSCGRREVAASALDSKPRYHRDLVVGPLNGLSLPRTCMSLRMQLRALDARKLRLAVDKGIPVRQSALGHVLLQYPAVEVVLVRAGRRRRGARRRLLLNVRVLPTRLLFGTRIWVLLGWMIFDLVEAALGLDSILHQGLGASRQLVE